VAAVPGITIWDLWIPNAAAQGVSFARGRADARDVIWVHAAPPLLRVEVRDDNGVRVAFGDNLAETADTPMTRLHISDGAVSRDDRWPENADLGDAVILPGGEIGILTAWWNAPDHSEWRWSIDLYNHR
jgi:hypothetical protein